MATSHSTMGADARPMHPDIINAAAGVPAAQKRIERLAAQLTRLMQDLHGDEWRFSISHDCETAMIFVVPKLDPEGIRYSPKPEVA